MLKTIAIAVAVTVVLVAVIFRVGPVRKVIVGA